MSFLVVCFSDQTLTDALFNLQILLSFKALLNCHFLHEAFTISSVAITLSPPKVPITICFGTIICLQIFIDHLLRARHCSRDTVINKIDKSFSGLY